MILRLSLNLLLFASCSNPTSQSRLNLAEKLLSEGRYEAAVSEFERVISKDPSGSAGIIALRKCAEIQSQYLTQYSEALKKLNGLVAIFPEGESNFSFKKEIARIYFEKTEQFDLALGIYRELLTLRPHGSEAPFFWLRISQSQYYLWQFESALKTLKILIQKYPKTIEAEEAQFAIANTYLTAGDRIASGYSLARQAFENFLIQFPNSKKIPEAKFGIANCLEELGLLSEAQLMYESVSNSFPSPNVVKIRLIRLRERLAQIKGKNEKSK